MHRGSLRPPPKASLSQSLLQPASLPASLPASSQASLSVTPLQGSLPSESQVEAEPERCVMLANAQIVACDTCDLVCVTAATGHMSLNTPAFPLVTLYAYAMFRLQHEAHHWRPTLTILDISCQSMCCLVLDKSLPACMGTQCY